MAKVSHLSFANLTCRFGDRFVLVDLAREVILPAFFADGNKRTHGKTSYFFVDLGIDAFDLDGVSEPQVTIYGRFVKDTVVKRHQVFVQEKGLLSDVATMESAPSMFFALDLNNHKLVYFPEVSGAPSAKQFASTLQLFAGKELESYIRSLSAASKMTDNPKGLGELRVEYPPPVVEVTPLAGDSSIDTAVEQFNKITRVSFQLRNTNAEFSRAEDFRRMQEMKDDVVSDTTTLIHANKVGLRKEGVIGELKVAAASGNQKISVRGTTEDGTPLEIRNEELKFQLPFVNPPENRNSRAAEMIRIYQAQIEAGRLRPDVGTPNLEKLNALRGTLDGSER